MSLLILTGPREADQAVVLIWILREQVEAREVK